MSATTRRTAALLLGAALVTLSATACNSTGGSSVSTEPKQSAAASAPAGGKPAESKPTDAPKVAKLGDTIPLKGNDPADTADVTLVKVVDSAEPDNEFIHPADGKRFVAVQFRIKATGKKAYSDAPGNGAKVLDAQGQAYGSTVADTKAGPSFQVPANIAPGESALGFVTFEVPKDAKLDKAQFGLDSGFAPQTGQWKIG
ncbi:DUF4352 domain-containing protein [Streptomyces sp. NRRL WC-3742]|uniref:DUF4352 domain-containing protein n=1 Tax=Streptomyces sp. NRRL WC-3742 TaxID=1463934 RepID=UPI000691B189|nr:DUF4352 domain-containing protein [Streptomyces sp. NRRL WC-3742]